MTKQEALEYINTLPENSNIEITVTNKVVTSSQLEKLGVSRQLLRYYVTNGYVRTVPHGKQKRYLLDDILKIRGKK
jgi:hypothetical protein